MRSKWTWAVVPLIGALVAAPGALFAAAGAQPSTSTTSQPSTSTTSQPSTSTQPSSTVPRPATGESRVEASVAFRFCATKGCNGEHVFIDSASNHYGSKGYSLCTTGESSTDFVQRADLQRQTISMIAKTDGNCYLLEKSYNTWLIEAYQGSKLISRGLIQITQDIPGLKNYYATCLRSSLWVNFACEKGDGALSLIVSRTDERPPPPPPRRPCPSGESSCYIDVHFDTKACPNFTATVGACAGTSTGDSAAFVVPVIRLPALIAGFSWAAAGSPKRMVRYAAIQITPNGTIDGTVANPSSSEFDVSDAFALLSPYPGVHWYTPDRPGVPAGELGGPLLLTFQNGYLGADVYIRGYLVRK